MADLEEDMQLTREILKVTDDVSDRAILLHHLGCLLDNSYMRSFAVADLNEAIEAMKEAIDMTPEGLDRMERQDDLGILLIKRSKRTRLRSDLEEAISVIGELVRSTLSSDEECPRRLSSLGVALSDLYRWTDDLDDLEKAIEATRKAVDLTAHDHPSLPGRLSNLGARLHERYKHTHDVVNLDDSIRFTRTAIELTPRNHPDQARLLSSLGTQLSDRYRRLGVTTDIEEAISATKGAIQATPHKHPDRASRLSTYGTLLQNRYSRTRKLDDLEEAIEVTREAIQATPSDHPDRFERLSGLGSMLTQRYQREGTMFDFKQAIQAADEATAICDAGHTAHQDRDVAATLREQYLRIGTITHFQEAVQIGEAIKASPVDHPNRATLLNTLDAITYSQYQQTNDILYLEDAIQIAKEVLSLTSQDDPNRAMRLVNLGRRLGAKYTKLNDVAHLEEALLYYRSAISHEPSPAVKRIEAGRLAVLICALLSRWDDAYEVSTTIIDLVTKLTRRDLQTSDLQHGLGQIVGSACDAAAVALEKGAGPLTALNLLESGRGVLATSIQDRRADVSDLQRKHPGLALDFLSQCKELESLVPQDSWTLGQDQHTNSKDCVALRVEAAKRLDFLVAKVRRQPGFETFLVAPSEREMLDAARDGAIVLVNVSTYRCDAIIVTSEGIQSLALPDLRVMDIEAMLRTSKPGSPKFLEWLWDFIAKPVLDTLHITHPPLSNEWPTIWWVLTGSLSRTPIHAAGYHKRGSTDSVIDRAVSSYSPSIKAIVQGRHRHREESSSLSPSSALLVAMENTPGHPVRLNFANEELQVVRHLCKVIGMDTLEPGREKQDIMTHLPQCRVFHFAGHGHTHDTDPSQSYLALNDWERSPLTVADLLDLNLKDDQPFLAYLSACGTGQIKDEKFFDESIHLIGACQLAGFRHVIGTLWQVNDEICVEMARLTYEGIKNGGMNDKSVRQGLHLAIRELRDRWLSTPTRTVRHPTKVSIRLGTILLQQTDKGKEPNTDESVGEGVLPRDLLPYDEDEDTESLQWVPYVQYGV